MSDQAVLNYSKEKGFHRQTLDRWLRLAAPDREALWDLVREINMGESHLRDFLDWLEEIALRDGVTVCEIAKRPALLQTLSDPRLGRNDKLKRIKEELRRLRFPRLAGIEERIRQRIRDLRLSPGIRIYVPAGLEGGALTVQLKAASHDELTRLVKELSQAVDKDNIKYIFNSLEGKTEGC